MVLYVSVVLLATLAVLPAGRGAGGTTQGPVGVELVAIIWGTTIGLSVAHWFAFQVARQGFGGGLLRGQERREALSQLLGAMLVAAVTSVPVVLFRPEIEQRAVLFLQAGLIGAVGYVVERVGGRSRVASSLFGASILVAALAVAFVKVALSGH
jgi:hypothetical protein